MDYRIIFLIFVFAVLLLYRIRSKSSFFSFVNKDNILSFLMVLAIAGAIGSFVTMMLDHDPLPWVRRIGYEVGLRQLVNYAEAVPPDLANQLNVVNVLRKDTDNDNFNEWLVLYEFESGSGITPIRAVVYDNDRGNPPTIFPYSLQSPNNAYLSSGDYQFVQQDVVTVDNDDIDELLFWGYPSAPFGIPLTAQATDLTIFRYRDQGGSTWDPPTDSPSRYVPVGRFHGDAVGPLDPATKEVTVVRQGNHERSLLATRYVYALNNDEASYMQTNNPGELNDPIVATIDFYPDPPSDIYSASVPEQIVLGFYAAMCSNEGKDLCIHRDKGWNPKAFLAEDSDALKNYQNDGGYFGVPKFSLNNISVRALDVVGNAVEGSIVGQQGQVSTVRITFTADTELEQTVTYELHFLDGKWHIFRQLKEQVSTLGAE
ncbi:hypothetical protein QUF58_01130 [Anaerolineales bacterium HSG24]|nr:hypothetical protein [Anaerolineales bacterium HSG24]